MSQDDRNSSRKDEYLGVALFLLGVVPLVLVLTALMREPEPGRELTTVQLAAVSLIDAFGAAPCLLAGLGIAGLGAWIFAGNRLARPSRHLLGVAGAATGLAVLLGAFDPALGGKLGARTGGTLSGISPLLGGAAGGLVVLGSVWIAWLHGRVELPKRKPRKVATLGDALSEKDADGVSAAESNALVPDAQTLQYMEELWTNAHQRVQKVPMPPSPYPEDVRLQGGIPEGASALPSDDDPELPSDPDHDLDGHWRRPGAAATAPQPTGAHLAGERRPASPTRADAGPDDESEEVAIARLLSAPAGEPMLASEPAPQAPTPVTRPLRMEEPAAGVLPRPSWEVDDLDEDVELGAPVPLAALEAEAALREVRELLAHGHDTDEDLTDDEEASTDLDTELEALEAHEVEDAADLADEEELEEAAEYEDLEEEDDEDVESELEGAESADAVEDSEASDDEEDESAEYEEDEEDEESEFAEYEEEDDSESAEDEDELDEEAELEADEPESSEHEEDDESAEDGGEEAEASEHDEPEDETAEYEEDEESAEYEEEDEESAEYEEEDEESAEYEEEDEDETAESEAAEYEASEDELDEEAELEADEEEAAAESEEELLDELEQELAVEEQDLEELEEAASVSESEDDAPEAGSDPEPEVAEDEEPEVVLEPTPAPSPRKGRGRKAAPASEDDPQPEPEAVPTRRGRRKAAPAAEAPAAEPAPAATATLVAALGDRADLVLRCGELFLEQGRVAVSLLQRRFELDFEQACEILDDLQELGLIGPYMGGQQRDILLTAEAWRARMSAS